ncbi:wing morphogenesis defect-like protein [Anopheles sinensis]|uniref:Wing morphogenesis defect-like protein n=1 Tax=Anopheles sinensis TaxID=74873 RepID=A0A084WMG0_ANOSI|nr:wing morphogenesis defect-like protein [Anopheles sinensis]
MQSTVLSSQEDRTMVRWSKGSNRRISKVDIENEDLGYASPAGGSTWPHDSGVRIRIANTTGPPYARREKQGAGT